MAKIVINAVSAKSGGAATYLVNLACYMAKHGRGHQYFFCVPSKWMDLFQELGNTISVIQSDVGFAGPWARFFWDQVYLRGILLKEKADVLISSADFGMWLAPCKQILMVRNTTFFSDFYIRTMLREKTLWQRLIFYIKRYFVSISVQNADLVLTASETMMDDLKRAVDVPDAKAVINPFGTLLQKFHAPIRNSEGGSERVIDKTCRLLYVSEYGDYKNIKTLLKAIQLLREKGLEKVHLRCTACPDQFMEVDYQSRKEDMRLYSDPLIRPYVEFVDPLPYDKMPALYSQCDIFVFPSLLESFGHPMVEAMASGVPVVASDIPICHEICGEAAVYFSPLDAEALAKEIFDLWKKPEQMRRLSEIGRRRAEQLFRWEDHAERLFDILKPAIEKQGQNR